MRKLVLFCISCFLCCFALNADELTLASVFTDNAVFQQGKPVAVWGKATPGKRVTVNFAGEQVSAEADKSTGKWFLYLPAMEGGPESHELTVVCEDEFIRRENILIGEVWFASGQSNMDFRVGWLVKNMDQEIKEAELSAIRFFQTNYDSRPVPIDNVPSGHWEICSPETVSNFSAVAYFFAKNLHLDKNVPVGVIASAIGATRIESWMSTEALSTVPGYKKHVDNYDMTQEKWDALVARINKANNDRGAMADTTSAGIRAGVPTLEYDDRKWEKLMFPLRVEDMGYFGYWGMVWARKEFDLPKNFNPEQTARLYLPVGATGDKIYLNGEEVMKNLSYHQDKSFDVKAGVLRPGKNVLAVNMFITWGVGGVGTDGVECCFKMEDGSNIDLTKGYWRHSNKIEPPLPPYEDCSGYMGVNYNGMVHPFIPYTIRGFLWYQGEANSLEPESYPALQAALVKDWRIRWRQGHLPFLFVQLANYRPASEEPMRYDDWASFRDAQTESLDYMENAGMACTIDVGEAEDIHPKNKQDVGARLYTIAKALVYDKESGIEYSGPLFDGMKAEKSEITIRFSHAEGLHSKSGGDKVPSFALEDAKGHMVWAEATISGKNSVTVKIPKGFKPVKIQYAWGNNPEAPLYNSAGLPAVPFKKQVEINEKKK